MKRIIVRFIACLPILFFMQVHAQILYEGMYSSEWEQERDEYLRGIERRRQEQERAIRNLNISIPTQPTQSTQSASTQRNNASRQAAINAKRKAHNLQVQKRNQQLAALNRQRQIEAEKRRREEERLRKEAEQRKREETRQRVTAETYQRLEGQTRSLQAAAAYASGEGGYRLREQHDVSRYEKPIQRGTGNAVSQIGNSPRQKFSYDNNNFVIDPQKEYHLATWDNNFASYEMQDTHSTTQVYYPPTPEKVESWQINETVEKNRQTQTIIDDIINSKEKLLKEGQIFDQKFTEQIYSASNEQLIEMAKEWEDIYTYANFAQDVYKDQISILPKGYSRISESDPKLLSKQDRELYETINTMNMTSLASGFSCELYKSDNGKYILSFRGTENSLQDYLTDAIGATHKYESQATSARITSTQIAKILKKYETKGTNNEFICTGHSLGGRLAQEAALTTGAKAFVYNSADVALVTKLQSYNHKNIQNIKSIASATDPLTTMQRTKIGKKVVGDKIIKNEYILSPKAAEGGHRIGQFRDEINDRYISVLKELDRRNIHIY